MTEVHPEGKLRTAWRQPNSGPRLRANTTTGLAAEFQHKSAYSLWAHLCQPLGPWEEQHLMQCYLLISSPKLGAQSVGPHQAKCCPPCCVAQTGLGLRGAWLPHLPMNIHMQGWEKPPKGEGQKDKGPQGVSGLPGSSRGGREDCSNLSARPVSFSHLPGHPF